MAADPEARAHELYQAAAAAGELRVSFEDFRRRLQPLWLDEEPVTEERAAELYLACACEAGDEEALARFDRELGATARAAIARIAPGDDQIDEVMQELRQRLFCGDKPKIGTYGGRGPLWKWLRITATRAAQDFVKSKQGRPTGVDDVVDRFLADDGEPEFRLLRGRYEPLFRQAFVEAMAALDAQERTILRLRYVQNQGIDRLSVVFGVHRATVARWLETIRDKMLSHVQDRIAADEPNLTRSDVHSLWRAVRSQVHFSFARLVVTDPPGK
jgi:RNA polymerase sigma-70 factor (ECF subfamily)